MDEGGRRRRFQRIDPSRAERGDHPAQDVAAPGGGEIGGAGGVDPHRPSGCGHHRRRTLEQHDGARGRPRGGGRPRSGPGPGRAPVSRSNSPSWGVRIVVALRSRTGREVGPERDEGIGVEHEGSGITRASAATVTAMPSLRPRPGPSATAPYRSRSGVSCRDRGRGDPARGVGRDRVGNDLGARRARRGVAGKGRRSRCRRRGATRRAPPASARRSCPALPPMTSTPDRHLCVVIGSRRDPRHDVGVLGDRGPQGIGAEVDADVGDVQRARQLSTRVEPGAPASVRRT